MEMLDSKVRLTLNLVPGSLISKKNYKTRSDSNTNLDDFDEKVIHGCCVGLSCG